METNSPAPSEFRNSYRLTEYAKSQAGRNTVLLPFDTETHNLTQPSGQEKLTSQLTNYLT